MLDTASSQPRMTQAVATTDTNVSTVEEEIARKSKDKGKALINEEAEQPRKISEREQAQIDWDAEQARLIQEKEVSEFMEERRKQRMDIAPTIPNTSDLDYE